MKKNKFRCWDEDNEVMYYSDKEDDDCIFAFEKGEVIAFLKHIVPATLDEPPYETGRPCTDIMQFTGLLDKNGKEIYEGDIMKVTGVTGCFGEDYGVSERDFAAIFEVIWISEIAGYDLRRISGDIDGWSFYKDDDSDLEVIGNVMENPELLEKANGTEVKRSNS